MWEGYKVGKRKATIIQESTVGYETLFHVCLHGV